MALRRFLRTRLPFLVAFGACTLALPDTASAQDAPSSESARPARIFGAGTAIGGGVAAYTVAGSTGSTSTSGISPALLLPSLEIQGFLPGEYSIDVSVPLTNIIVIAALSDVFLWNTDFFFNFNFGDGGVRGIVGPGLGFSVATVSGSTAGSLRLPAELGVEFLTAESGFGFKMMARPYAEFAFAQGSSARGIGGGVLGVVAFTGYVTD